MNKKGFTLIEIIGAIIIVSILGVLAVVTFTSNMKGFREDYYIETVRTLTESGKEFFNDNKKYRPSDVLTSQIVPMNTLVSQKYLDEVSDYKGNSCSNSSYVIVIKNGKDDYTYHSCLVCPEDDYSNMADAYCDDAWRTSTSIEYTIATPPELYVYLGTPRSSLRDLLAIKASYVKKNSKGEIIGVVDGTGFDETPTIYPENFDTIDTNTIGVYPINYEYQGRKTTGHVTVYKFEEPNFQIKKQETYVTDLQGHTTTSLKELYISGTWTQKIFITLSAGASTAEAMPNVVNRYQWNKDGVWQDLCLGTSCTEKEITIEMNENIKFRSISVDNRISDETVITNIKIDNTKPVCTLSKSGPQKTSDWYTGDVTVTFNRKEDLVRTSSETVSGIKYNNITISNGAFSHTNNIQAVHNYDTKGVTYIGYVEDQARNFITCDINFRRDATNPTCTLKTVGTRENDSNQWYNSANVVITFNTKADLDDKGTNTNSSGIKITRITGNGREHATSITDPSDTDWVTYTGYVEDNAGNNVTCTTRYKKDSTPPGCVSSGGTTTWLNHSTTIYGTCSDALSLCRTGYTLISKTYSSEINSSTESPGVVIDNAGNRTTCPGNQHVHIDLSKPTCTTTTSNSNWTNGTVTLTGNCRDSGGSGCKPNTTISFSDQQNSTQTPPNVADNAGNEGRCDSMQVRIDKTKPQCGSVSYGGDATGGVAVSIGCSDTGGSNCTSSSVGGTYRSSGSVTIRDGAGNTNSCGFNVTSYTQHKERTWNSCKSGNTCVGAYEESCTHHSQIGVSCSGTVKNDIVSGSWHYYDCCTQKWNSCKSRTPCVGGWNGWSGYSNGACPRGNSSTYECSTRTMYHGG